MVLLGQVADDGLQSIVRNPNSAVVVEVQDAATLKLDDGRVVELMGVEGAESDAAKEWLTIYTLGRRVTLRHAERVGFGRVRAVPVLWEKTDVVGLMLLNGHGRMSLRGTEPEVMVAKWRGYERRAVGLRLGLWARTGTGGSVTVVGGTVLPARPSGVLIWPQVMR
jgi:endonuclease YncB( thermonuclease family)